MHTIVMTGGTAGLGKVAAEQIAGTRDTRLLLGARRTGNTKIETLPLDLSRLAGVRAFARAVGETLAGSAIDSLVLNAGAQFPNLDHVTVDGFEETFAVNHLAHYLLLRLLLPKLAPRAVVVITASDTHDPAINPLAPPLHADAQRLAHPALQTNSNERRFIAGFRAYSSSKLCNILTARALATQPEAKALGLTVVAYNPGFTPGTALGRAWPLPIRALVSGAALLSPVLRLSTVEQAGEVLADLALGRITPPNGQLYASLVRRRLTWPDPSELARRDDALAALWRDSAVMVSLS